MNRDANAAACQVLRQPSPLFKHYHWLLLCAATCGVYTYCSHVILRFECVFFQHCGFELGPRRQGWPIGMWSGFQQNSLVLLNLQASLNHCASDVWEMLSRFGQDVLMTEDKGLHGVHAKMWGDPTGITWYHSPGCRKFPSSFRHFVLVWVLFLQPLILMFFQRGRHTRGGWKVSSLCGEWADHIQVPPTKEVIGHWSSWH